MAWPLSNIRISPVSYKIKKSQNKSSIIHINWLKKFVEPIKKAVNPRKKEEKELKNRGEMKKRTLFRKKKFQQKKMNMK